MAHLVRRALDHSDFATVPLAIAGCLAIWPARDADAPAILLGSIGVCLGIGAWTLIEYAVHRALHDKRFPRLRRIHMRHHAHPTEASGGTLYSSLIILVLLAAAIAWPVVAPVILGLLVGYLLFIVLHHGEHHGWDLDIIGDLAAHHDRHHHAPAARMLRRHDDGVGSALRDAGMKPGRIACEVPFCRRTASRLKYSSEGAEIICGPHWRLVSPGQKKRKREAEARERTRGGRPFCIGIHVEDRSLGCMCSWCEWERCKAEVIEKAMGI